jgi:PAS domain S-box-containing protein
MNLRLSRLVPQATTVGLALIVVTLVANTFVSEWNTNRLLVNEHRVALTQKVLTTIEEVLLRVTEAETGERGFLITDDDDYLKSYQSAVRRTHRAMSDLSESIADDEVQQARLAALAERIEARMKELHDVIEVKKTHGLNAARQTVSTNQGRRLMNEMTKLVGQMQDRQRARLAQRAAESRRSSRLTTITDQIGALLGIAMVGVAFRLFRRDLAHRQQADDATRRLAAIVESSHDAIISKALDGTITSWNAGAQRVYGYAAEEAIGRSAGILCPGQRADEVMRHMRRVCRGERIEHFVTQRVRRDGARIDVSLSISPLKDADGNVIGASAISRDVTATRSLQREVLAIAEEEQRRIGQDLHDGTGQELTGLAMFGQRLAGALAAKQLPEAELAGRIVDGLEQALGHVRALSRGLVPVEVDAEGLMAALAELMDRTAQLHDVCCTFECQQPVHILDNPTATHLYRMSQEALANALKHGKPRHIAVRLKAEGGLLTLEIADDGQGLDLSRSSTGMGLRIMRYRAELIGASLTIESNRPSGTRVVCVLNQREHASWRG